MTVRTPYPNYAYVRIRMKQNALSSIILALLCILPGCVSETQPSKSVPNEPEETHSVMFGGDVIIGRRMNRYVLEHGFSKPLIELTPYLSKPDLTVVNLESVLSAKGEISKKGNSAAYSFRGRPELVQVLTGTGIDVATSANNHTLDYGFEAIIDHVKILTDAGISTSGAGRSLKEANAASFHKLGDVVVGILGAHATRRTASKIARVRAGKDEGFINLVPMYTVNRLVADIKRQVKDAREHAHLVFLSMHWGRDGTTGPSKRQRTLARRLIKEAGLDAILGSGPHMLHGIEVIDGRPVIYDAGNLLVDFSGKPFREGRYSRAALFTLHVNSTGVRKIEALPIRLDYCSSGLPNKRDKEGIIELLVDSSKELGTELSVENDIPVLSLPPGNPLPAPKKKFVPPPSRPVILPEPNTYEPSVVVESVPVKAVIEPVVFDNGVELLGVEIPSIIPVSRGLLITTYWRTSREVEVSPQFFIDVEFDGKKEFWGGVVHSPGDWMYPISWWKPGEVVKDQVFARAPANDTQGPREFFMGMVNRRKRIPLTRPETEDHKDVASLGIVYVGEEPVLQDAENEDAWDQDWDRTTQVGTLKN